jgi:hypothetical protein
MGDDVCCILPNGVGEIRPILTQDFVTIENQYNIQKGKIGSTFGNFPRGYLKMGGSFLISNSGHFMPTYGPTFYLKNFSKYLHFLRAEHLYYTNMLT